MLPLDLVFIDLFPMLIFLNLFSLQVKPNFPDFKRKDGRHSIWLDRAPNWVSPELEGLEFDVQIKNPKETKEAKGERSQLS